MTTSNGHNPRNDRRDQTPPRKLHRAVILVVLMLLALGLAALIAFGPRAV